MKKRYFIVAPVYDTDTLWRICSTTSNQSFMEVYMIDAFQEEADFNNEKEALRYVRARGSKRAYII